MAWLRFLPAFLVGALWLWLATLGSDTVIGTRGAAPEQAICYFAVPIVIGFLTIGLPLLFRTRSFWFDRIRWTTPLLSVVLLLSWMFNAGGGV
jgi:hypothetical protein